MDEDVDIPLTKQGNIEMYTKVGHRCPVFPTPARAGCLKSLGLNFI